MQLKRLGASFFLVLFLWASIVAPAHAFLGLAGPLMRFGMSAAMANATEISLLVHGAVLSYATVTNEAGSGGASSPDGSRALEVQLNPKSPPSTPTGWTNPNNGQPPTPPASAPPSSTSQTPANYGDTYYKPTSFSCTGWSTKSNSPAGVCSAGGQNYQAGAGGVDYGKCVNTYGGTICSITYSCPGGSLNGMCIGAKGYSCPDGTTPTSDNKCVVNNCPVGYSSVAGNCVLTDASKATQPSDGKCSVHRSGNSFYTDPADPDCLTGKTSPDTTNVMQASPSSVTVFNPDTGVLSKIEINADGTSKVTQWGPGETPGTSKAVTATLSAPNATTGEVKVVGISQSTVPGMPSDPNAKASAGVTGGSSGSATASQGSIDLGPTVGELKNLNSGVGSLNTKSDGILDKVSKIYDSLTGKADAPKPDDFKGDDYGGLKPDENQVRGAFTSITNKLGLSSGGQCGNATLSLEFLGRTTSFSMVGMCNAIAPIINWFFWILVVIAGWREALGLGAGNNGDKIRGD